MLNYIIRRLLYAIPILIGVNLITFTLFFVVNTPDDMARMQLGIKRVTPEAIARWKQERGYDKPLMFNNAEQGFSKLTHTVFFEKSVAMFAFRFGRADCDFGFRYVASQSKDLPVGVLQFLLGKFQALLGPVYALGCPADAGLMFLQFDSGRSVLVEQQIEIADELGGLAVSRQDQYKHVDGVFRIFQTSAIRGGNRAVGSIQLAIKALEIFVVHREVF